VQHVKYTKKCRHCIQPNITAPLNKDIILGKLTNMVDKRSRLSCKTDTCCIGNAQCELEWSSTRHHVYRYIHEFLHINRL